MSHAMSVNSKRNICQFTCQTSQTREYSCKNSKGNRPHLLDNDVKETVGFHWCLTRITIQQIFPALTYSVKFSMTWSKTWLENIVFGKNKSVMLTPFSRGWLGTFRVYRYVRHCGLLIVWDKRGEAHPRSTPLVMTRFSQCLNGDDSLTPGLKPFRPRTTLCRRYLYSNFLNWRQNTILLPFKWYLFGKACIIYFLGFFRIVFL